MKVYLGSNLKLLRQRRNNMSQQELASALGVSRSQYSGYEYDVVKNPNYDLLIKFSDYFGVSIDTLLKIELSVLSEAAREELLMGEDQFMAGGNIRILATTVDKHQEENIELVNKKAKAGYLTGYGDAEFIEGLPKFNLPFLNEGTYRAFEISGDSMLPVPDRSIVIGKYVEDWKHIKSGKLFVIVTIDEGIVFKKVTNTIQQDGLITLVSLNTIYPEKQVPVTMIKEVWEYRCYITTEVPEGEERENMYTTIDKMINNLHTIKETHYGNDK